jgi:DNA-binding transcriptional regulator YdaS (Cro superfamily)
MAVYFIQAGDGGPVKIGFSENIWARLNNMQPGNHAVLRVVAAFIGGEHDERAVHEMMSAHRTRGEWFAPDVLARLDDVKLPRISVRRRQIGGQKSLRPGFAPAICEQLKQRGVAPELAEGSVQMLADAIGCHRTTVVKWERVPADRVPAVSAATGVPRHKLRPDLWQPPGEGGSSTPNANTHEQVTA